MGMTKNDSSGMEERDIQVEQPSIIGTAGEFEGQIIRLAKRMRLGRHRENDVCFKDPTVSAFHVQITAAGDDYEIMDLGSKNRSRLNGKKISRPVFLADNDVIEIGESNFRFRLPQDEGAKHTYSTPDRNSIRKPKVRPRSLGEIVCKQKTRGLRAVCSRRATVRSDSEGSALDAMVHQDSEPAAKMNRGEPKKTERVVTSRALRGLVVLIVGVIVVLAVVAKFVLSTSPTLCKQNTVAEHRPPRDRQARLALIQRIWEKWESELPEKELDVPDIDILLDGTLGQADQMCSSTPDVRWRFYKTCLKVVRATRSEQEDSENKKQAEQLLLRVKIEMEDEEQRCSKLLQEAKKAGRWSDAGEMLRHIRGLLDLEHDNQGSELAQVYCDLELEIKQECESRTGS